MALRVDLGAVEPRSPEQSRNQPVQAGPGTWTRAAQADETWDYGRSRRAASACWHGVTETDSGSGLLATGTVTLLPTAGGPCVLAVAFGLQLAEKRLASGIDAAIEAVRGDVVAEIAGTD